MKNFITTYGMKLVGSIFATMGVFWLPLEALLGLENLPAPIGYVSFVLISILIGLLVFVINGFYFSGFLRKQVEIRHKSQNTKVVIKFGDIFEQVGWKSIGVNDFFDYLVNDKVIANSSLHGIVINRFWTNNSQDWVKQVEVNRKGERLEVVPNRKNNQGNKIRYSIGSTSTAKSNSAPSQDFIFVALSETNAETHEVSSTIEQFISALRQLLQRAREECADQPLNIPLMGSGLARIPVNNALLIDLILVAIFEETNRGRVTSSINVVLHPDSKKDFNLAKYLTTDWN